jgi:hypothetical protein
VIMNLIQTFVVSYSRGSKTSAIVRFLTGAFPIYFLQLLSNRYCTYHLRLNPQGNTLRRDFW